MLTNNSILTRTCPDRPVGLLRERTISRIGRKGKRRKERRLRKVSAFRGEEVELEGNAGEGTSGRALKVV
jgi:hypothetical protein